MLDVVFVTGNQNKIDFLQKHLGFEVDHRKIDLEEIQSMDLKEIIEHKVREAYSQVKRPVLVEDIALFCDGLVGLPGPLVKWFLQTVHNDGICQMVHGSGNNKAEAAIMFAYFEGSNLEIFEGRVKGTITLNPRGEKGYGWDPIFIPEGSDKTYAEMSDEEIEKFGLRTTTVFPQLRDFFSKR